MQSNYKKWPLLLAAGAFLCLCSCEEDKEQEVLDEEDPVVSLEVTGSPTKLYNEVVLSSTATDNDAVERVVFYVNSDSIGQATSEPYELNWNTKEVEDGSYMLKAVAFDAAGNQGEAAKEVVVNNTLLVIDVGDNYPVSTENIEQNIWVFLSDKNGQIIGEPKQLNEGENLRWERPSDFYADTIYLNRLVDYSYTQPNGYTFTNITVETFPDFFIEETTFGGAYSAPNPAGEISITVENDFEGTEDYLYRTIVPTFNGFSSTSANTTSYSLSLGENSQQALSTYENMPARTEQHLRKKYYRMDELEVGNEYVFHTSEYAPMEGQMVSFPANTLSARIVTFGYFNEELQGAYFIDNSSAIMGDQGYEAKIFTVDAFPYVHTTISGSMENKNFTYATLGEIPNELVLPKMSATVETEELKNVEVAASGAFDLGRAYWNYTENSETQGLSAGRILYFGNEPAANYVLPDIPASLLELFPVLAKPMNYANVSLTDYENVDSYEDYLSYQFHAADIGTILREYFILNIMPENSGGRMKPFQEAEPAPLAWEKRHHMPKNVWPK